MYRLTIRIRSDDTIRLNTNTLFRPLFSIEANTKWTFGTSLITRIENVQSARNDYWLLTECTWIAWYDVSVHGQERGRERSLGWWSERQAKSQKPCPRKTSGRGRTPTAGSCSSHISTRKSLKRDAGVIARNGFWVFLLTLADIGDYRKTPTVLKAN